MVGRNFLLILSIMTKQSNYADLISRYNQFLLKADNEILILKEYSSSLLMKMIIVWTFWGFPFLHIRVLGFECHHR